MGHISSKIFNRFFDYPLKKKPFCVHNQTTVEVKEVDVGVKNDYNIFNDKLNRKLAEKRSKIYKNSKNDKLLKMFPEWNGGTISYLHSLFLTFCDSDNKMLNYESFECVLECLGDESVTDIRKNYFNTIDKNTDGLVNYMDFLKLVYNFHFSDLCYDLKGLSKKVAEKVMLINKLSVEEQLEYGLF